ncbi:PA1571 family protein [Azotobacter armeniacus]
MSPHKHSPQRHSILPRSRQHSGGAIIDAHGREIPITEGMIQKSCRILDRVWVPAPRQSPTSSTERDD